MNQQQGKCRFSGTVMNPCSDPNCSPCKERRRIKEVGNEMIAKAGNQADFMRGFFNKHVYETIEAKLQKGEFIDFQTALAPVRELFKKTLEEKISETKKNPWCKVCLKRANLYCCNGIQYCSSTCQHKHWYEKHKRDCQHP